MKMNAWLAVVYLCTRQVLGGMSSPWTGNVCYYTESYQDKDSNACGFWGWSRCTKYKLLTRTKQGCCEGWTGRRSNDCSDALCDGKTNPTACKRNEGFVLYKNGTIITNSGGSCEKPDVCTNCNEGYYSDGPYCRACTKINNCNVPHCTSAGDTTCVICEGQYGEGLSGYGKYAYTRFLDNGKTCRPWWSCLDTKADDAIGWMVQKANYRVYQTLDDGYSYTFNHQNNLVFTIWVRKWKILDKKRQNPQN